MCQKRNNFVEKTLKGYGMGKLIMAFNVKSWRSNVNSFVYHEIFKKVLSLSFILIVNLNRNFKISVYLLQVIESRHFYGNSS